MGSMFGWESATPLQILLQMLGDYISKIQFNIIVFSFLANRFHSDEERRIRRSNMKENFQIFFFLDIYLKKPAHPLFGAWLILLVLIQFTPSQGSKSFYNFIF